MEKSELDKVYMAAFIDAEGSIYINRQIRRDGRANFSVVSHRPEISVGNTNLNPIKWMYELWPGGSLKLRSFDKLNLKVHSKKTYYQIIWGNQHALNIIVDIMPYLKIKKPQAKLLKSLILYKKSHRMPMGPHDSCCEVKTKIFLKREEMMNAMIRLNNKGNKIITKYPMDFSWGNYELVDGKTLKRL